MTIDDLIPRVAALQARVDTALAKARRATGKPRIPGDGDGDGIPNEGRKRTGGGSARAIGSAAKPKFVNVGSAKWPLQAKAGEKLPGGKDKDGFTHHVPGFKGPELSNGRYAGDNTVQIEGKTLTFSGKAGTNIKTGQRAYEFSDSDDGRFWIAADGRAQRD